MNADVDQMILKTQLTQSDSFGAVYEDLLGSENSPDTPYFVEDVKDLYNKIILNSPSLTEFQEITLNDLFAVFNKIRLYIDPNRLKPFDHFLNGDNELLIFRNTDQGLVNIIIHSEDCIAFSFIPRNEGNRKLYFLDQNGDFEHLAYDFFSI